MSHADGVWLSESTFILPSDGLRTPIQKIMALPITVFKATI
jgi:hypothetical protein